MIKMNRTTFALVTFLASIAFASGCASDRSVISQANQAHNELKPAVMEDPDLASYLQSVGERIIAAARVLDQQNVGPKSHKQEDNAWMFSQDMKFHFVNSKTLNAFTTGGEHMYIYTELFEKCRSEDELAAVMAHEYAHVYCRHVHKGINRQATTLGIAAGAGVAGAAIGGKEHAAEYGLGAAGVTMAAGQFIGMGYTRKDEAQADEYGFDFYSRAGWDPNHFGDFFQQMIDLGYDTTPEMMSDHPSLASRVEDAKKRVAALPPESSNWKQPPIADAAMFKRLQARAAELGKVLPNDQSMEKAQALLSAFNNCFAPAGSKDQSAARQKLSGKK